MGQVYICSKCKVKIEPEDDWVLIAKTTAGLETRAHAKCASQPRGNKPAFAVGSIRTRP